MDRGTDCRDVLLGKTLKLRHGWVAVVNRGQADINSKVGACGGTRVSAGVALSMGGLVTVGVTGCSTAALVGQGATHPARWQLACLSRRSRRQNVDS